MSIGRFSCYFPLWQQILKRLLRNTYYSVLDDNQFVYKHVDRAFFLLLFLKATYKRDMLQCIQYVCKNVQTCTMLSVCNVVVKSCFLHGHTLYR